MGLRHLKIKICIGANLDVGAVFSCVDVIVSVEVWTGFEYVDIAMYSSTCTLF